MLLPAAASAAQPPQRSFAGVTTVLVVEVPVRVFHRGAPVRGLTADDFEIWDGKVRRPILSFEAFDATAARSPYAAADGPAAAAAEARNYLFLFDLAYGGVGPAETRRRMTGSVAAVRAQLGPATTGADRLAVGYVSPLRGLKLIVDFTTDRGAVHRALDALELVLAAQPGLIEERFAGWSELAPPRRGWRARTQRGPIDASLADLVAEARGGSHRGAPDLPHSSHLMHLSRDLQRLGRRTDLAGPRHLVLLSMGPLRSDNPTRAQSLLDEIVAGFRRQNWAIESIDTGGLGFGRDSLLLLAQETGGRLYTNSLDLGELLSEMAESTSVSYRLAFQVDDLPADGAYHRLRVRLVGGQKGARVVHRPGYYAPSAVDLLGPR